MLRLSLPAGWHGCTLYFCPQTTLVLLCSPFTRFLLLAPPHCAETPELLQGTGTFPRTPPWASSERKALNSHPENTKGHYSSKGNRAADERQRDSRQMQAMCTKTRGFPRRTTDQGVLPAATALAKVSWLCRCLPPLENNPANILLHPLGMHTARRSAVLSLEGSPAMLPFHRTCKEDKIWM